MQGRRAWGGAQSSHQERGAGPRTEGAGSARRAAGQGSTWTKPSRLRGQKPRLEREGAQPAGHAEELQKAGVRRRGSEPAHPVTLKQSVPAFPLPRLLPAAPRGLGLACSPQRLASGSGQRSSADSTAFRNRVSPSVGSCGGHAYIPGAATWWRCAVTSELQGAQDPRGAGPVWGWVSRDVHLARPALLPPWDLWPLWFVDKGSQESFYFLMLAHFKIY